jgi:hypothetical protein
MTVFGVAIYGCDNAPEKGLIAAGKLLHCDLKEPVRDT